MNKFLKYSPLYALLIVVVSVFSGCLFTIPTPTVAVDGYILSWDSNTYAKNYEVVLNDESMIVADNSLDMAWYLNSSGVQSAKVKTNSKNFLYNDSEYSATIQIIVPTTKMSTPQNVAVNIENNQYMAEWNSVSGATRYVLKLINKTTNKTTLLSSTTTSLNLTKYMTTSGAFVVSVRAVADDLSTYAPSEWAESDEFEWLTYLETPTVTLSGTTLRWNVIEGAKEYVVSNQRGDTVTVSTNSCNLSTTTLLGTGTNNMTALFVQAVAENHAGYDSAYSDGVTYYSSRTESALKATTLSYLGSEFDLYANDEAELHDIVFYAMYYRITDMKFIIGYSTNYSTLISTELNKYNEIMSISYNVTQEMLNEKVLTLDITFRHPNTPTLTASGSYTVVQSDTIQPTSYTTTPRSSDYDDFAIDERTKTMVVFNSDQLYVALQNGFKPVFTSVNSPAQTVYNLAKQVLRETVDDSMTDLQKVTAIYDWLSYTVKYDYNLLEITEELESKSSTGSTSELSKYKGFYIEGVLLDNGQAVCDGISKTFVLLCSLENIDTYKVSGVANGGNHAWNKVSLDLDNDNTKEWYTVDATWGDCTEKSGTTYTEYLSHSYFLVTDTMIEKNSHRETSPNTYESTTEYNYYANTTITDGTNTQSLYITSSAELTKLFTIVDNNKLTGIEFASATSISWSMMYQLNYNIKLDTIYTTSGGTRYIYIVIPR